LPPQAARLKTSVNAISNAMILFIFETSFLFSPLPAAFLKYWMRFPGK
jgi:hypothetical protein